MNFRKDLSVFAKVTKLEFMALLTAIYAILYGALMTGIDGWDTGKFITTTSLWALIYGYLFFTIGAGIGLSTIIYYCISFGQTRKTAIRIWSYSIGLNLLFGLIFGSAYVFKELGRENLYSFRPSFFYYISNTVKEGNKAMAFIIGVVLIISLGLVTHAIASFLTALFLRYNWRIMVGAIILTISGIFFGISRGMVLLRTGQNIYAIIGVCTGLAALLLFAVVQLAKRVEVKN